MSNARVLTGFKRLIMKFFTALCLAAACLFAPLSQATASEASVNSEVSVDVTGRDSAEARSTAMSQANTMALKDLLDKLAAPGQSEDIIATLDSRKISAMTRGTEVLEERIGDNRYRARLLISFDANEISGLISRF